MDLELKGKYADLRAEVREFVREHGHRSPRAGGGRRRPSPQVIEWQRLLIEHGYAARTIPREYGGYGAEFDVLELAVIAEVVNEAGVHPGIMNQGISMLVPTLLEVGTEEQRRRWIEPTITGELIWCQGYSEPGAGSDLASVRTRADLDGDHFVINGQKIWTSSAHYADMMFLLCRTERDAPKHEGLSYLLVPMDTPGIEVRPLVTMTEHATFNETFFTDARVPADQIVMGRGDGWRVANITLKHERMLLGDPNKVLHRLYRIREMMEKAAHGGVPAVEMAAFRDRFLELEGKALAWKYHGLRLLSDQANDEDPGVRRLIVKYAGTMLGHEVSSLAVDVLGAAGLPYEPGEEGDEIDEATNWYVDYLYDIGLVIGGGTSNVQKNIISERGLGMPREPKVGRQG